MELKDKVIIITGAGKGLGRQFALECAENGMKVALADVDAEAMEKTRKECEAKGVDARGYELDVTKESEVEAVYSQVVTDFGTLDATINNAGILRDSLLVKKKDDEIRWLFALLSDSGMRLGEAVGLLKSDIKLDSDIPHIELKPHSWR